jgi:hypothetical protein
VVEGASGEGEGGDDGGGSGEDGAGQKVGTRGRKAAKRYGSLPPILPRTPFILVQILNMNFNV